MSEEPYITVNGKRVELTDLQVDGKPSTPIDPAWSKRFHEAVRKATQKIVVEFDIPPQMVCDFAPSGPVVEGSIEPEETSRVSIEELKAALERRGFHTMVWIPEDDQLKMVVRLGDGSTPWAVSREDLSGLMLDTKTLIESGLGRITDYQHFVWCKQCHEPILRHTDQDLALKYLQNSAKPDVVNKTTVIGIVSRLNAGMPVSSERMLDAGDNMEEAIKRASVYRRAKDGPYSPSLTDCPGCGVLLEENTEEIVDA